MNKLTALLLKLTLAIVFTVGMVAQAADEVVYFHPDAQGTATAAYTETGQLCWEQDYTPYGEKVTANDLIPDTGCGLLGGERGYTGHVQDVESGLAYMQQRYYDPRLMRFRSVDPVGVIPEDHRYHNRYAYAANNPMRYIDPDGRVFGDPEADQSQNQVFNSVWSTFYSSDGDNSNDWNINWHVATQSEALADPLEETVQVASVFVGGPVAIGWKSVGIFGKIASWFNRAPRRGLGNPFKNKNLNEIDKAFEKHVQSKKLELKYINTQTGAKSYMNTKSRYSYNLDPGGRYGRKLEEPHVDVNYPNPKPAHMPPKKKLPVSGGF